MAKLIQFTFTKSIAKSCALLWFTRPSLYSGQLYFNSWDFGLFNTFFTLHVTFNPRIQPSFNTCSSRCTSPSRRRHMRTAWVSIS